MSASEMQPGPSAAQKLEEAQAKAQARAQRAADAARNTQTRMQLLDGWLDAVLAVAAHYQIDTSRERLRVSATWQSTGQGGGAGAGAVDLQEAIRQMAQQAGMVLREVAPRLDELSPWRLPVVLQLRGGQVAVVTAMTDQGLNLVFSGDQGAETLRTAAELQPELQTMAVLRPLQSVPDSRVDDYIRPVKPHWLRAIVFADVRPYFHILLASLITNLMALGGILFSMQIYDRVVPAQSMPTLYVLFGGVLLSIVFSWAMRSARMHVTDLLGKRADLRISDRVFGHALRVRNSARPKATGTFVSQIRELEPVREMLTSTTVAAVADLPFFVLFCAIFWMIAGWLVWVPLAAFVLLLLPSLLAQKRLRTLAQDILGDTKIRYAKEGEEGLTIDFGQPFQRLTMVESILKFNPDVTKDDLATLESATAVAKRLHIELMKGWELGHVITAIFEETVEHMLLQPTFITEYPAAVSPLARRNDVNPDVTDRFEFFIGGRELANGFSELNDAEDQAKRFQDQVDQKAAGDDEAMFYDADFVTALEHGLPPTAGQGIGIDRLVMLFTNSHTIRDVILFPALRPQQK